MSSATRRRVLRGCILFMLRAVVAWGEQAAKVESVVVVLGGGGAHRPERAEVINFFSRRRRWPFQRGTVTTIT